MSAFSFIVIVEQYCSGKKYIYIYIYAFSVPIFKTKVIKSLIYL